MRKIKLIGGSIILALALLASTQAVLAWGIDIICGVKDENLDFIIAGNILIAIETGGKYEIVAGPMRDDALAYDAADSGDAENLLACIRLDDGFEMTDVWSGQDGTTQTVDALDALCYVPDPPKPYGSLDALFIVQEKPTAWSLGVESAFTTTQMQEFIDPNPYAEGGNDFIPSSAEWLTDIKDHALSWLQIINQDDFLFFLMAFGLINYIISWLWRQLSGSSVMSEAQAWRGVFDDGED